MPNKKPKAAPKIRYISPDMLWDAPQSPRSDGKTSRDSQASLDISNAYRAPREVPDKWIGPDGKVQYSAKGYQKMMAERERRRAAQKGDQERHDIQVYSDLHRLKANTCPFCGIQRDQHPEEGCPEYNRLLREFQSRVRPIRPGVPWSWAVEHYAKQGKTPPLPKEMYD